MKLFETDRERRFWLWALAVVIAIYATLPLAGTLAQVLRDRSTLNDATFFGFLVVSAAIVGIMLNRRPGHREFWIILGVTAVLGMAITRMGVSPDERTHLIEYGLVAVLIHHALTERLRQHQRLLLPAALAVAITALLGLLDETI